MYFSSFGVHSATLEVNSNFHLPTNRSRTFSSGGLSPGCANVALGSMSEITAAITASMWYDVMVMSSDSETVPMKGIYPRRWECKDLCPGRRLSRASHYLVRQKAMAMCMMLQ